MFAPPHISINLILLHFTKASVHHKLGGKQSFESTDLPGRRRRWRFCTARCTAVCDSPATPWTTACQPPLSVVQTDFPCEASVAWKLWKKLRLEWLWGPS